MIRVFSVIIGLVLLLPGACGVFFLSAVKDEPSILIFVLPGLLLGALGLWFIFKGGVKKGADDEPS